MSIVDISLLMFIVVVVVVSGIGVYKALKEED